MAHLKRLQNEAKFTSNNFDTNLFSPSCDIKWWGHRENMLKTAIKQVFFQSD